MRWGGVEAMEEGQGTAGAWGSPGLGFSRTGVLQGQGWSLQCSPSSSQHPAVCGEQAWRTGLPLAGG